ncbi:MAG TPA: LLM class flavin-dependent oxidoreductase [Rhizobiaceae bacterium]|nr:LLM class flavin-dependent oxidoreductase [Rhizobiaceae bacterium]
MAHSRRDGALRLGALLHPTGNHVAAWLHPDAQIDAGVNFAHYAEVAQIAERARFDLIFLADALATREGNLDALRRWPQYMAYFEPLTLLSAIAAVTKNIGLVATATTSYNEPYQVARKYASLDHISGGRAGWNMVTSTNPAEPLNFGRDAHFDHADRYERAREFAEVVRGLWDSWEDDAFVRDRETATYFLPEKLHRLDHVGKYFKVRGPLNVARAPQGYPVMAQAGSSEAGKEFAAETAEIVFSAQTVLAKAKDFYRDVKDRMAKYGRPTDQLKIMPGLNPIVGRTEAEARDKHEYLQSLIHPDVGRLLLQPELGIDLTGLPIDEPIPAHLLPTDTNASKAGLNIMRSMVLDEKLTIRQMYMRYAGARGQRTIVGTPKQIADEMETWFHESAVDGFLIQPGTLPMGLQDFADLVVPELQSRGLFRREYEGRTLRENLGLARPKSRYAA